MKNLRSAKKTGLFSKFTGGAAILLVVIFLPLSGYADTTITNLTWLNLYKAITNGGTVKIACDGTVNFSPAVGDWEINIDTNLVIDATGHNVVFDGGGQMMMFWIGPNSSTPPTVTMINLTFANGFAYNGGGAIYNGYGYLYLYNCIFTNNMATTRDGVAGTNGLSSGSGNGGAGQAGAKADEDFSRNQKAFGGAILNYGFLSATNCTFVNNVAKGARGGDGGNGGNGGGTSGKGGNGGNGGVGGRGFGGAIYSTNTFFQFEAVYVTNCVFINNSALGGNGGNGGSGGSGPGGYGAAGGGGASAVGYGGAIYAGNAKIYNCSFYGNVAEGGNSGNSGSGSSGANGPVGAGGSGGAIFNTVTNVIVDSTLYGNAAAGGNGGSTIATGGNGGNGTGGGIYSQGTKEAVTNCTISSCSVYAGNGGYGNTANGSAGAANGAGVARTAGTFTLKNTIVAYSSAGSNGNGTITDAGNNISSDGSINLTAGTSHKNTDPLLSSLAYNGGFTPTCALLLNSPAIDAADASAAPINDQRNYDRLNAPDIGAYEYNGTPYTYAFISVQAADAYAIEANTNNTGIFSITRTGKTSITNIIGLSISGTAVAGTDYAALPTNIVLLPGILQTNLTVKPLINAPVTQAKTVVLGIIPSTTFMSGLYTNAVVTLIPPASMTNSVPSPVGRYWRGSGSDPTYWSSIVPLDYETGTVYSNVNGNCSALYPGLTSWLSGNSYHYNATNSLSQTNAANRIAFDNPIVAFGERVGGTPLYIYQPYSFGIYAGDPLLATTQIVIQVYYRTNLQLAGSIRLNPPIFFDTNSWSRYATNGFQVTTNAFGLTTTLSDTPTLSWGAISLGAYVLTHTANDQATNYCYLVEASGYLDSLGVPMVQDTNGQIQASLLYTLEFERRPQWRSVFLDQPHFDGSPLPPFYAGMTLAEMLTNAPPVTNVVNFTPSTATNLDGSPELRRHPLLDQFVADMGNDPIALANYVINSIDLTDPMDYNENGNIAEQSINPGGVSRGALGTFLEKQGSPVEQCALLVYLLRQAGVPAVYEFAPHNGMKILDTRLSRMLKFQVQGGFSEAGQLYTTNTMIAVNYPWVAAYIGTNWVHIFPWLKDYEINEGLNLYEEMPTNYSNAYGWVKDYIYGKTNLLSLAVDGDNTPRVIFPKFLQQTLLANHPGVSVDDIGVEIFNRQHYYARWQDFPAPTWVTNVSTPLESLTSSAVTNISPTLTNIFDTVSVEIYSFNNPARDIQTGDLRLVDLHNREFYVYQSATNSGQVQLSLILMPFRTNVTTQASFTNDSTLLSRQALSMTLDSSDSQLKVRFRYHRHRAITPAFPIDQVLSFLDFNAGEEVDIERPLQLGDQAAICMDYGQVTSEMLNVHAQDLWQMENALRLNPSQTNAVSPDVYEGALMYLAGMSYYEKVSEFKQMDQRLHKVNALSLWAAGLSKISPARDSSGNLANGNVDPVLPNVDMFFYEMASIANGTARPDSGQTLEMAGQNYNLMFIADGSAEEHQTINRFYRQTNAVSTVRLLQLAQSKGGGIVPLNINNYVAQGQTVYQGQPLQNWDSGMWQQVASDFQNSSADYVTAYITPGPMTNSAYKGMAALVLGWGSWAALISPGSLNGGFGEYEPPQTIAPINTDNYDLGYNNGSFSISFTPPASGTQFAPDVVANFDYQNFATQLQNNNYAFNNFDSTWQNQVSSTLGVQPSGVQNLDFLADYQASVLNQFMGPPSNGGSDWLDKVLDPVRPVTGEFSVDETDLQLPGPMPLSLRRNYSSQNLADNQFGTGWKFSIMPYLSVGNGGTNIYAADMDGAVLAYVRTSTNASVWLPTLAANPQLDNNTAAGAGGLANRLRDWLVQTVNGSTTNYILYGADGSVRTFQVMTFNNGILNQTGPYLQKWTDNRGNFYTFAYGTNSLASDFGQVRRILCSNGNFLGFYYDIYGHIIQAYSGDGRRLYYNYDQYGDLITVTLPDDTTRSYQYQHLTQAVTNGSAWYSTHLIIEEDKPDGRELINAYDSQRRVTNQLSTAGADLNPIRTATFIYANNFNITNSYTNTISGYTLIVDGNNHTNRYDYTNSLITKVTDPLGQTIQQIWYADNATAPGYPRSVATRTDKRGLVTQFQYDSNGNVTNTIVTGDLTGDGVSSQTATNTALYNSNSLPVQVTDAAGNGTVIVYDPVFNFLPQQTIRFAGATPVSTNFSLYGNATNVVVNGNVTQTNLAFGLPTRQIRAYGSLEAATNDLAFDGHGFITQSIRYSGTGDPNIVNTFFYNERGEMVEQDDALGAFTLADYDALNRPIAKESFDESGNPLAWSFNYYNDNGELTWVDGPRYNPEDYVFFDYDGAGRRTTEIHWRSEAKSDGTGVETPSGYNLYAQTFYQYDPLGNLTLVVDPRGAMTTNTWDALGRLAQTKHLDVDGVTVLSAEGFSYEPGGQVQSHTNALGGVATTLYTITGKPEFQSKPDGSTNAWRYYLDGRVKREIQRNGAYWQTTYDDVNRITTRTFYSAAGVPEAVNSIQLDRRGNVIQKVDAGNNAFTATFDGLDRPKVTAGPAIVTVASHEDPFTFVVTYTTNVMQQTSTNFYDAAGRSTTNINALGEATVARMDALGRTISTLIYNSSGSLVREKYFTYSADHNSVTVTDGSGASAIANTSWTDNDGHTVLAIAYPSANTTESTLNQFDLAGNLILQQHNSSANGAVTTWATTSQTFDGLNRLTGKSDRDNAITTYALDPIGDLTNRTMPGGLQWQATYNNAGQELQDSIVGTGGVGTRTNTYTYYSSGSASAGLLQTKTDNRGLVSTYSYDDWLRQSSISRTTFNYNHVDTFWSYDPRGYATNITEQYTGNDGGPDPKVVSRTFDAYGQLSSETITVNGASFSSASQTWDAAGRRTGLGINGASYNFASRADGALTYAANPTGSGGYSFDTAGLLTGRTVGNRSTSITSRDGEGRPLSIATTVNTLSQLNESLTWSGDGLLATHTLTRSDFTDSRAYSYATLSRRLAQEQLNLSGSAVWTNSFVYDSGIAAGSGVLTQMGEPGPTTANWNGGISPFSRVNVETNTSISYPASGRVNGQSALMAWLDGQPLSIITNSSTDPSHPIQWRTMMELSPGAHQLKAAALHPSGFFTAWATNSFTNNLAQQTATIARDSGGNIMTRIWRKPDGTIIHQQHLYWDAKDRLTDMFDYDSTQTGFNWHAEYDGLNRRLFTVSTVITNGQAPNLSPTTINQYYDPMVEFLELGVSYENRTEWKLYGPDLNGRYGGLNGTGGLDGVSPYLNLFNPVISDFRGNILGEVTNGVVLWNAARPTGYGAVPNYRPVALGHGADVAQSSAWRGRWVDITGYYNIGMRLYDPIAGMWLSYDSTWNERDPNYLTFCGGEPIMGFDADGRCLEPAYNKVADTLDWQATQYNALVNSLDTQTTWKQPLNYASSAMMLALADASSIVNMGLEQLGMRPEDLMAIPALAPETRALNGLATLEEESVSARLLSESAETLAARNATTLGTTTYKVAFDATGNSVLDAMGIQNARISNINTWVNPELTGSELVNTIAHEEFHAAIAESFPNFAASSGRLPYVGAFPLYAEEVGAYAQGAFQAGQYGQMLASPISAFGSMTFGQSMSILGTGAAVSGLGYYNLTH
jgi:RHS repeat-associated protein